MPISYLKPVLGSKVHFAREGETVETVTVSQDNAPAAADFSEWQDLGCLGAETSIQRNTEGGETVKCFNTTTMLWEDKTNTRGQRRKLSGTLELQQISNFALSILFDSEIDESTGEFIPASRVDDLRGYLNFQIYVEGEGRIVDMILWVELTSENEMSVSNSEEGQSVTINFMQLKSANDKGTITDPNA